MKYEEGAYNPVEPLWLWPYLQFDLAIDPASTLSFTSLVLSM